MGELEGIVGELEASRMPLADLVGNYERGTQLLKFCQEQIAVARKRVETITVSGTSAPANQSSSQGAASNEGQKSSPSNLPDDDVRLF